MTDHKQTRIQPQAAGSAPETPRRTGRLVRGVGRGAGTRIGASLVFGFLLLLPPSQAHDSFASTSYCDAINPGITDTCFGAGALYNESGGDANTAFGYTALNFNSTGNGNTATGMQALLYNTSGGSNAAVGQEALTANTTGSGNTAVGSLAGVTPSFSNANTTGSNNTFLGSNAGPGTSSQLSNAAALGANALVSESNALVLGGTGSNAVRVGIGTSSPASTLQVGAPSTSYGAYLQVPMVTANSGPPAADCSAGLAGRIVLQYDPNKSRTTLWSCTAGGTWTRLAQG